MSTETMLQGLMKERAQPRQLSTRIMTIKQTLLLVVTFTVGLLLGLLIMAPVARSAVLQPIPLPYIPLAPFVSF